MKRSEIRNQIRQEKPNKRKQLPSDFINKMAAYCVSEDIHMDTIYQLCKVKHMNQMLDTMYDNTLLMYKLHEPTILRFRDASERKKMNELMEGKGLKLKIPIY